MHRLSNLLIGVSLFGFMASLPMAALAVDTVKPSINQTKSTEKVTLLFVLSADKGVIAKDDKGYTITLKGMDKKVLYFTDRPIRKAGFLTVTQFMKIWTKGSDSFKVDPPNASLVHAALKIKYDGVGEAVVVELMHPVQTVDGVTFQLKDIAGKIKVGEYDQVYIFVDSFVQGKDGGLEWDP